jgi:hypothetical protein
MTRGRIANCARVQEGYVALNRVHTNVTILIHLGWKRRLVPFAWLDFDHRGFAGVVATHVAISGAEWSD